MCRPCRDRELLMSLKGWFAIGVGVAALVSCEDHRSAVRSFALVFMVESDPGVPLGRAHVFVNGAPVGQTDSNGLVHTSVDGRSGPRLRIEHDCPDGYEEPPKPKVVVLRRFKGVDASGPIAMEITLRCRPEKRLAVFVVRASNGPHLPVLLDGRRVARTNSSGVAHFFAWGPARTEYVVELDTRDYPRMAPQLPTHLFTLPDADEIFVVSQSFELEAEPTRRGRRRTRITKIE